MMDNSIIPLFLMHRSVARRPEVTLPDPPSETVTQRRSRRAVACQAPNAAPAVAVGQPWKGSRAPSPRAHTLSPSHTPRWRDRRDPPVPRPSRAVPGHPACHGPAVGMAPSTVAPILPRQPPPSAAGPVAAVPSRAAAVGSVPLAHAVRRPGRCWLHPALRRAGNWLYCSPGGHKAGTASPTPPLPLRRGAGRFFREISCSAPLPPHVPGPPDPPPGPPRCPGARSPVPASVCPGQGQHRRVSVPSNGTARSVPGGGDGESPPFIAAGAGGGERGDGAACRGACPTAAASASPVLPGTGQLCRLRRPRWCRWWCGAARGCSELCCHRWGRAVQGPVPPSHCCPAAPNPFVPAVVSQGAAGAAHGAPRLSRAGSRAGAEGLHRIHPQRAGAAAGSPARLWALRRLVASCLPARLQHCAGATPRRVWHRLAAVAGAPSPPARVGLWALEERFPPRTPWSVLPVPSSPSRLRQHPPAGSPCSGSGSSAGTVRRSIAALPGARAHPWGQGPAARGRRVAGPPVPLWG